MTPLTSVHQTFYPSSPAVRRPRGRCLGRDLMVQMRALVPDVLSEQQF